MIAEAPLLPARWRALSWGGVVAIVVLRYAIPRTGLTPFMQVASIDVLTYLLPITFTLVLAAWLSARTLGQAEHSLWGLLTAAVALVLVSEVYYTYYLLTVDIAGPPDNPETRVLHWVALGLYMLIGVRMTTFKSHQSALRSRVFLDGLGLGCLAFALVYLGWTLPLVQGTDAGPLSLAVTLAFYPVAGVLVAVGTGAVLVWRRAGHWRTWERMMALAMGFISVTMVLAPLWLKTWVHPAAMAVSFGLLIVALTYRLSTPLSAGIASPWPMSERLVSGRLESAYPVVMASGLPVLWWFALSADDGSTSRVLVTTTLLLALSLVGRSLIADYIRAQDAREDSAVRLAWPLSQGAFDAVLSEALGRGRETATPVCVVVFLLGDSPGGGDPVAQSSRDAIGAHVAVAITAANSGHHHVFRLGRDRFAVVCEATRAREAASFARRVWLHSHRGLTDTEPFTGVFSGISEFPRDGDTSTDLLGAAQTAAMKASSADQEPVMVYESGMSTSSEELEQHTRERIMRGTVRSLAQAVDSRHAHTHEHSARVSELSKALASVMGLPDERVQVVGLAALLHDVGKVGLRDDLGARSWPGSIEEQLEIEEHVALGERIIAPTGITEVLPAVRHHHERWDGSGYPDGLGGNDIPLEARILAVCDAYEIFTTGRPDHPAMDAEDALEEIEREADTRFDPTVVSVFGRLIRGLRAPVSGPPTASA